MDRVSGHIISLVLSEEYARSAAEADELERRMDASNRFQVDTVLGQVSSFFSRLRQEKYEIYSLLEAREKSMIEKAIEIKTGRRLRLD